MSHPKIKRVRGDTAPDRFIMTDEAGAVENITGWSFRMTVDSERAPPAGGATALYTLVGVIDDAGAGKYSFAPSAGEADQAPGNYWFDIEATDAAGRIKTVELDDDEHTVGVYQYTQDLSK